MANLHDHIVCNRRLRIKEADQANKHTDDVVLLAPVLELEARDELRELLAYANLRFIVGIAHA